MVKRWFNSEVQSKVMEIDCEGAKATVHTIEGIKEASKFALIKLPDTRNEIAEIIFQNLTDIEKEVVFYSLDYELHNKES